jgi:hypothetical protein
MSAHGDLGGELKKSVLGAVLVLLLAGCGSGHTSGGAGRGVVAESSTRPSAEPRTVSLVADQLRALFTELQGSLPRGISPSGLIGPGDGSCPAGTSRGEVEVKLIPSGPSLTAAAMKALVVAFFAQRGWRFGLWTHFTPDDFAENATAWLGGTYIIATVGTGGTGSDATVLLDGHTACLPGAPVTEAQFL